VIVVSVNDIVGLYVRKKNVSCTGREQKSSIDYLQRSRTMSEEMDIIKQAMDELVEQRDTLLKACKEVMKSTGGIAPFPDYLHKMTLRRVNAAISLVEKGKHANTIQEEA